MQDFVGRLPPIGASAWLHLDRISQGLTNPEHDEASIDLEVLGYYAIVKGKLDSSEKKPDDFDAEWAKTEAALDEMRASQDYSQARRLQLRLKQLELLTTACVKIGLFDVAHIPTDQWRTA